MSFNTTNYFLFSKRKPELDNELLSEFSPYMTTKTFSFYSDDKMLVSYINDTLNTYSQLFSSKEDQFRFFENVIPIVKRKKINYIKKPKVEKVEDNSPIPEFYSKREIDMMESMRKYLHESRTSVD